MTEFVFLLNKVDGVHNPYVLCVFITSLSGKKKKKGSFDFNIINRKPTKYYLNHYAHTVAALLVLSAVFLGSLITSGKK